MQSSSEILQKKKWKLEVICPELHGEQQQQLGYESRLRISWSSWCQAHHKLPINDKKAKTQNISGPGPPSAWAVGAGGTQLAKFYIYQSAEQDKTGRLFSVTHFEAVKRMRKLLFRIKRILTRGGIKFKVFFFLRASQATWEHQTFLWWPHDRFLNLVMSRSRFSWN